MTIKRNEYIYGPVPSRRLGFSVGVDMVPPKTCSFDCVYCQVGRTTCNTVLRDAYIPEKTLLDQLLRKLETIEHADFITLAGSGEPTLNSGIGSLIRAIRKHTSIPVAVITNSSLMTDSEVRRELMAADAVLPSLDAHSDEMFQRINRPHSSLALGDIVEGMIRFREAYAGQFWLEIFLVKGINASETDARLFKEITDRIKPHKIHLNTAVRPTAESGIRAIDLHEIEAFRRILGPTAEIIVPFHDERRLPEREIILQGVLDILARRPCTIDDLAAGLNANPAVILKAIAELVAKGTVREIRRDAAVYFQAANDGTTPDQS